MLTIIGCGNANRRDDGLGPHLAQRLGQLIEQHGLSGVQAFDAGTAGMDVMFRARDSQQLIIIDACQSGSQPGAIFQLPGDMLSEAPSQADGLHGFRWQHALHAGREIFGDGFPSDIRVYLVEAQDLGLGLELSEPVQAAAATLIEKILAELQTLEPGRRSSAAIHADTALRMAADTDAADSEKAAMLGEVAAGLQHHRDHDAHSQAARLLRAALALPGIETRLQAQLQVQLANALSQDPAGNPEALFEARILLDLALALLGDPVQLADAHLHQGLVIQSLAETSGADPRQALRHYQAALLGFGSDTHPAEYAIIHNNIATLWLSMTREPGAQSLHEAMAVQSFETALKAIDSQQHPQEYAMLQNNLGNALQYADSTHGIANRLRALEAYEQALALRRDQPALRANTLANRANCLRNLPDDPDHPSSANPRRLAQALADATTAAMLFREQGDSAKTTLMTELCDELQRELDEVAAHE